MVIYADIELAVNKRRKGSGDNPTAGICCQQEVPVVMGCHAAGEATIILACNGPERYISNRMISLQGSVYLAFNTSVKAEVG